MKIMCEKWVHEKQNYDGSGGQKQNYKKYANDLDLNLRPV